MSKSLSNTADEAFQEASSAQPKTISPSSPTDASRETLQVGTAPVQAFSTPVLPADPSTEIRERRGRPSRATPSKKLPELASPVASARTGTQDQRPHATIPPTRREALAVLTELCELSPEVRLGQLLAHLSFRGEDQTGRSLSTIDDEQLLAVLYRHRADLVTQEDQMPQQSLQPAGDSTPASPDLTPSEAGRSG